MNSFTVTLAAAAALLAGTVATTPPTMTQQGAEPQPVNQPPPPQANEPAAPAPSATTNPQLLATAKHWFAQLQAGKIDKSQLEGGPYSNMTDASIANAQKMVGSLGAPVSFVQQQYQSQGNVTAAIYLVTFSNGEKVDFLFALDQQGKVAGLSLGTPH